MGIATQHALGVGDPDGVEHRQGRGANLPAASTPVRPDDVAELTLDAQDGVEGAERVLGNEPDTPTPDAAELPGREVNEIGTVETHRSRGDPPG